MQSPTEDLGRKKTREQDRLKEFKKNPMQVGSLRQSLAQLLENFVEEFLGQAICPADEYK